MKLAELTLLLLSLFALSCCNSNPKTNERNTKEVFRNSKLPDTASEATILNPRFAEDKMHGVGLFKIGNTIQNSIEVLLNTQDYKLDSAAIDGQEIEAAKKVAYSDKLILKLIPPASTEDNENMIKVYAVRASWCPDVEAFIIEKYKIDSLYITNLGLVYYRGKLIYLHCDGDKLGFALASKYGEPDDIGNYLNGDIKATVETGHFSSTLWVKINGADNFLSVLNEKSFTVKDSLDKLNKNNQLKNL